MEIIATIGPSSNTPSTIRQLWCAGVTIFRLNLSYVNSLKEIDRFVDIIKEETDGKTCLDTHGLKYCLPEQKKPSFTKFDLLAIKHGAEIGIDQVAVSFAQSSESILQARKLSKEAFIIAKIESKVGVENQTQIIAASNAILIDRGDLSRFYPAIEIPKRCKMIITTSKSMQKPVYVATNLLESMTLQAKPTMGEINDIASLILQGVSGLVLAAETAIGEYPIECVEFINKMVEEYNA